MLALLQLPVTASILGGDLASAIDPYLLKVVLGTPPGLSALVATAGLALMLVIERVPAAVPPVIRVVPPVVVILSMTLVGHATSRGVLTGMLLSLHLAGIGYWLAALFSTAYAQVLLVKMALVSGVLGLAAVNKFRLVPALRVGTARATERLRRSIEIEIGIAGPIFLATSLLTTTANMPRCTL